MLKSFTVSLVFIYCLLIIPLLYPSALFAATNVGGPIRQNTTWTASNSPYIILQSITINRDVTLTIEPGVRVEFFRETDQALDQGFNISVEGQLIAKGTEASPIVFTSSRSNPEPGDWEYIEFTETAVGATYSPDGKYLSGSIFEYVTVEYGSGGDYYQSAIWATDSAPYLNHVTITNNDKAGITYYNVREAFIDNSAFIANYNNSYMDDDYSYSRAINFVSSLSTPTSSSSYSYALTVNNSIFTNNKKGAIFHSSHLSENVSSFLTVNNSNFTNNSCNAIYSASAYYTSSLSLAINNSTFTNNSANDDGGAICCISNPASNPSSLSLAINNSTFTNNSANDDGGAIFSNFSYLTVDNSTFTSNSTDSEYGNGGAISFYGNKVVIDNSTFTSNSTDSEYGNGNGDGGDGGAIFADSVESLAINNSMFTNNSAGLEEGNGGAVFVSSRSSLGFDLQQHYYGFTTVNKATFIGNSAGSDGGAIATYTNTDITDTLIYNNYSQTAVKTTRKCTINKCTIIDNYPSPYASNKLNDGLSVGTENDLTSFTISDSNIFGHGRYDINNNSSSDITAKNNYWGTTDEMSINLNVFDKFDDSDSGEVIYYPYLSSFASGAPAIPGNCVTIDNFLGLILDLIFDCAKFGDSGYQFRLNYSSIQNQPQHLIWKLDLTSFQTQANITGTCMEILPDFTIKVTCAEYNGAKYSFDMHLFSNPQDSQGIYFELDQATFKRL